MIKKFLNKYFIQTYVTLCVVLFVLLLGAVSCKSAAPQQHTKFTVEKDSIHTSVNYIKRDTTIVVPGDIIEMKVPVYSLTEVPITVETSRGTLTLSKINEEILAKCNIDDLQKIITLQDKLISEFQSNTKIETEYKEVEKKVYPKWLVLSSCFGLLSLFYFMYQLFKKIGI